MRRGDICVVDLDPVIENEANKTRPVVVVSNNVSNAFVSDHGVGTVAVVPIASRSDSHSPIHVFLPAETPGLDRDSIAQAEQVRTVSVNRIRDTIGFVDTDQMERINDALKLHLDL